MVTLVMVVLVVEDSGVEDEDFRVEGGECRVEGVTLVIVVLPSTISRLAFSFVKMPSMLCLSLSHRHSHTHSHTHTHTETLTHTLSLSHTETHSHPRTLSLSDDRRRGGDLGDSGPPINHLALGVQLREDAVHVVIPLLELGRGHLMCG